MNRSPQMTTSQFKSWFCSQWLPHLCSYMLKACPTHDMCFLSHKDFPSTPVGVSRVNTLSPHHRWENPGPKLRRSSQYDTASPQLELQASGSHGCPRGWPAKWGEGSIVSRQCLTEAITFTSSLGPGVAVLWGWPWGAPRPKHSKHYQPQRLNPLCLYSLISWERISIWWQKGPEDSMDLEAKVDAFCSTWLCPQGQQAV